jgi:TRAP-type C4-dicarboxylate transport system substrate-binding protein
MGYKLVVVDGNEIVMALNSGQIDAIFNSPVVAGSMQLFTIAKNMASFPLAPFVGGLVISNNVWRRVPDQYKDALMHICKGVEKRTSADIQKMEANAITTMKQYGLVVNEQSSSDMALWQADVDKARSSLLGPGKTFDEETVNKMQAILADYRK